MLDHFIVRSFALLTVRFLESNSLQGGLTGIAGLIMQWSDRRSAPIYSPTGGLLTPRKGSA